MNKLGLYLHIPFCMRKCGYCDFYSLPDPSLIGRYVKALCRQLRDMSEQCKEYTVDTVYLGGGTPSLLSVAQLAQLFDTLGRYYRLEQHREITIEVNPSSVSAEWAKECYGLGIDRVSIGLQSMHDDELQMLGRLHDSAQGKRAFEILRKAGFERISVDLMYALPGQRIDRVEQSVREILRLDPEHISAYCLKIEPDTPFASARLSLPNDDVAFAQYARISEILSDAGYERYEMSNFAKPDKHSRHNMKYWTGGEYLGFGPAAYSYFQNRRYGYARDLRAYLDGRCPTVDEEQITEEEKQRERIMLGLRLRRGVPRAWLDADKLKRFCCAGYMEYDAERAWLTTKGIFVSNAIIREFLD